MRVSTRHHKNLLSMIVLPAVLLSLLGTGAVIAAPQDNARYIVVFKDTVNPAIEATRVAQEHGLQLGFIYQHALKGMSAVVPAGRLSALQHDPRVAYVVEDMQRSISQQTSPTGIQRIFADTNTTIDIDTVDDYRVDVDVAVIDTGIDFQHPDLNVVSGVNCTGKIFRAVCVDGGDDDHYHGTHVAGIIGALDNDFGVVGVAPGARLWAVKVLNKNGSGWSSWIIAGIDYVAAHADEIEVANMSLGGSGFSQAEYDAIQGAVDAGVAFAVAAGNEGDDASNYSPGGFDNVLSVSALADFDGIPGGLGSPTCRSDQDDTLADFSNWGPEVDIAAPGVCIWSTLPLEQGEYGFLSGTSMASPHVAGALALLASRNNPKDADDVKSLYNQVKSAGNLNWEDDSGDGIQEPLLGVSDSAIFNPVLIPGSEGVSTNTAPIVSISSPENGASFASGAFISFTGSATDAEEGDLSGSLVWTSNLDGQFGSGGTFTTGSLRIGTHTITASVTDSGELTGSDSITITVEGSGGLTVSVNDLNDTSSTVNKNFWKATVTATIDPPLSGAVVSGTWSDGKSFSCTTDTSGVCSGSTNVRTKTTSIKLTINNVALTGYTYIPKVTEVDVTSP